MAEMETEIKFRMVLDRLLEATCPQTTDDYYELLITQLAGTKINNKNFPKDNFRHIQTYSKLLSSPEIYQWIERSILHFNADLAQHSQVYAFTLNLMALILINANAENGKNHKKIDEMIETLLPRIKCSVKSNHTPSIKLAFIRVMKTLLDQTYTSNSIEYEWEIATTFCLDNKTVYVVRESQQYLTQLMMQNLTKDDLYTNIFKTMTASLNDVEYTVNGMIPVNGDNLQRKITPTISFITYFLQHYVSSDVEEKSPILHLIVNVCHVETNLWRLTEMTTDCTFFKEIVHTLAHINLAKYVTRLLETSDDINRPFCNEFIRQMMVCLKYNQLKTMISLANIYWNFKFTLKLLPSITVKLPNDQEIVFSDLVMYFLLLPLIYECQKNRTFKGDLCHNRDQSDLLSIDVPEIFNRDCRVTEDSIAYTIQVLKESKHLLMDASLAKEVIEALIVILCDKQHIRQEMCLLIGISTLTKEYFRTIFDSNILHPLLKDINVNHKLTSDGGDGDVRFSVQIINFLQMLIEQISAGHFLKLCNEHYDKYCSNQLCLIFACVTTLMDQLTSDISWEIKDSLIEMITVITSKSFIYTKIQDILIKNISWSNVIHEMAKADDEPFVRASALKCLSKMVILDQIWMIFNQQELTKHLLKEAIAESEGIVRKEIVNVMRQIYEYRTVPADNMAIFHSTLAYCAVDDLHWEVRITALDFWDMFIRQSFDKAGLMIRQVAYESTSTIRNSSHSIDGKDKEKIDVILQTFSANGVFGILLECIRDDCDTAVIEKAAEIINNLKKILSNLGYEIACPALDNLNDDAKAQKLSIDPIIDECFIQNFAGIKEENFFAKSALLEDLLNHKSDWMKKQQDLDSLLDDMMSALQMRDVNSKECY